MRRFLTLWLLAAALLPAGPAHADELLQKDIREEVLRVPARVQDAAGREVAGELVVTLFQPPGPGPFPLLVISHGRESRTRAEYRRPRFEPAARFFVRKGFAVAVPLRLGYGELAALGDPESVACAAPRFAPAIGAAAEQIVAVARHLAARPGIDATRLVLVGQSVGGAASIAAAALRPAGLAAVINFAGGHGGNPVAHRGQPCQPEQLQRLFQRYGEQNAQGGAATPTLWIYTQNDQYFAPAHSQRWAEAYQGLGDTSGRADYRLLPAIGDDGHKLFALAGDVWQPLVDRFLAAQGFEAAGQLQLPAATGFARLDDEAALPLNSISAHQGYRKFLAAKPPRAFALNLDGSWGYASGDDALSRALGFCQGRTGQACRFYAVNDHIVWSTTP